MSPLGGFRKAFDKLIAFAAIVCWLFVLAVPAVLRGVMWETNPSIKREYEEKIMPRWRKKSTKWLIKKFKARTKEKNFGYLPILWPFYQRNGVKDDGDFDVALALLVERKAEPGVSETIRNAAGDPANSSRKYELIEALERIRGDEPGDSVAQAIKSKGAR